MANKKLGVKSAKELNGATVCVQPGTTTELNLADYFRANPGIESACGVNCLCITINAQEAGIRT